MVAGISLDQQDGRMLLDGLDVSEEIRSQAATEASSLVSTHPEVRGLWWCTREWVARHDNRAVVEGRDIGSVVFPDATVKVYLDARPESGRSAEPIRPARRRLASSQS